eukprot:15432577-Alexandrium_andersonii.AAC.1
MPFSLRPTSAPLALAARSAAHPPTPLPCLGARSPPMPRRGASVPPMPDTATSGAGPEVEGLGIPLRSCFLWVARPSSAQFFTLLTLLPS